MLYEALLWASFEHLFECFKDTTRHERCQFGLNMPDWLIAFGRGCGLHREELLNLAVCEAASLCDPYHCTRLARDDKTLHQLVSLWFRPLKKSLTSIVFASVKRLPNMAQSSPFHTLVTSRVRHT